MRRSADGPIIPDGRGALSRMSVHKSNYTLVDHGGEYFLSRESGYQRSSNQVIVKQEILDQNRKLPLERLVTISNPGMLNNIKVLRPYRSQYHVWFEGSRYSTDIKLNTERRGLEVELSSPEPNWQGSRFVPFRDPNSLYCFYSQVIECGIVTGFIDKAIELQTGRMSFHIIWEGYPYIQEQYAGIPNEVITPATLQYDGKTDQGHHRFVLSFADHSIFFHLDEDKRSYRKFWVAQGLSLTPL